MKVTAAAVEEFDGATRAYKCGVSVKKEKSDNIKMDMLTSMMICNCETQLASALYLQLGFKTRRHTLLDADHIPP